jgi:glucosamine-phosphate N-acetyltransferase|tara:strand:- start:2889 stop:3308 length:420 start_codon:yes stop_codon:yes gene_type:complete
MISSIKNTNVTSKEACRLLEQLTSAETLSEHHFSSIIKSLHPNQEIFVYKKNDLLVGMISVFIEQKIIHGGKCVAHIEDVVVDSNFRRQGIALKLVNHVLQYAENNNCYKVILNCNDDVKPFYEKCHFKHKTNGMAYYL